MVTAREFGFMAVPVSSICTLNWLVARHAAAWALVETGHATAVAARLVLLLHTRERQPVTYCCTLFAHEYCCAAMALLQL
jgi:hypothetical protein